MEATLAPTKRRLPRPTIPQRARLPITAALALLTGLGLSLISILITTQGLHATLSWLTEKTGAVFACALFLGLIVMLLALVTRSLFAGGLITSLVLLSAAFVNYFKTLITSTPLQLTDLGLIGKAGDIARLNSSSITFSRNSILALAAVALWLLLLLWLSKPLRVSWRASLITALAPLLTFLLLFVPHRIVNAWCYGPMGIATDTSYGQAYVNAHCGVPLGLWRAALGTDSAFALSEKDRAAVLADAQGYIDAVPPGGAGDKKPNVIMILSESFFDVTALPGVTYESDPLADFHAAEDVGVSGKFYTRTLGYGTCNIELELLTGINNRFLPSDEMLCYWEADRFSKLATVPRVFEENGYYTAFLHTFNDGIYNRAPVYEHLGFDDLFFSADFAEIDKNAAAAPDYWAYMEGKIAGDFYSDDYMAELLIDLYEQKREDKPVFLYGVTMENHTPYTAEKYDGYDYPFTADLSPANTGVLNSVTQGAADSSAMLGRLVDYFTDCGEPTVIIFFGDHRPGLPLPEGGTLYSALGMCSENNAEWSLEQTAELYSTDYVIWSNDEALLPGAAGDKKDSSCAFLGLTALQIADMPLDPYWRMAASVQESCTAYSWQYVVSSDGRVLPSAGAIGKEDARKLNVMTWLMREALSEDGVPAFYSLN
ncbi:MAG: LTA synthase family protein [Oscillospiraceae bacterium]